MPFYFQIHTIFYIRPVVVKRKGSVLRNDEEVDIIREPVCGKKQAAYVCMYVCKRAFV